MRRLSPPLAPLIAPLIALFLLFSLPAAAAGTTADTSASQDLDAMIGQMLMAGFRGFTVDEQSPIVRDIRERNLGGVVLFDYDVALASPNRNIDTPAQVARLTAALAGFATTPLLVAVDQEGGRVQRLKPARGFTGSPSAKELGVMDDAAIKAAGAGVGATLRQAGFNLDFAPVADVDVNPDSPAIGRLGRSFSADPARVGRCAGLFLAGLASQGVTGCLKHFPGHGSAGTDSHLGVTDVTATWTSDEMKPYRMLIEQGAARMIMTGHIFNARLDPDHPATLSHATITTLLRGELGFDGVIITDDMDMKAITERYGRDEAVRLAIEAGADILLFGNNLTYDPDVVRQTHALIKAMVRDGVISQTRIRQSHDRIMRLKGSR
ncbi:MAG: glycoside hydrolase family 3 [Proteobacteria bacterium]|uniref:Glycoside hydrolase family 3 domain protein n=1 Tax=Pseudodesulfovibrio aespoeensis (strain ATCC 700646 / DSM 10631 / Aspo-2) TaxID=643562 RepID=E6VWQ8_PSEA9|nr:MULTISPECIES: glycoside hydrolase family 3 N-terminal domain-containing protein [Pseudodesulfovibrio]MBU4192992.1 glycoside hydrolase family 3 [Pseudomonadota bacterium]ADU63670.1 glycoside hydrolase family 3 domain protein [Pseudodesulfovibrio aespoeensis Aspo-2]MBU4244953.1 glycoside hydrolase family 3 [Pseudomonadota bacterium]MBU4378057.1 glycoside hydrolase family 3 [Pseudomonadota bacterium]MBU4475556.1 glycoside hydrolase family 3 [Pseudomonadota bacterium]